MTYEEVLAALPPKLAHSLQLKLENCAISTHLTEEEAREIVDGVVRQVRLEAQLDDDEVARNIDYVFSEVTDAFIGIIFV